MSCSPPKNSTPIDGPHGDIIATHVARSVEDWSRGATELSAAKNAAHALRAEVAALRALLLLSIELAEGEQATTEQEDLADIIVARARMLGIESCP